MIDAFRKTAPPAVAAPDQYEPAEVATMLRELGVAMVEVSYPVQLVDQRLLRIAQRYTTARVQVAVLPTALFIQVGDSHEMGASALASSMLDMAARVEEIAGLAMAGAITPQDAVAAVQAARSQPPRFGPLATILGYGVTTVGFGMVIEPTWKALLPHLFLGLVVGVIVQIGRHLPNLMPIVPTLSAIVVTLLATWFVADVGDENLLRIISPSLIATLPGIALVIGSMELAGGRIVSGSSRTVYGLAQLGLMVYGVAVGVRIAGQVPPQPLSAQMGPWSFYAAIGVIAIGLYFYLSAPRGSLIWLLIVIGVALLTQTAASLVLNTAHTGFIAATVVIPFAVLIAQAKGAPPASVLLLAAFWSMVPGQLTFMSLTRSVWGDSPGVASVSVAGAAILSIALGAVVGWSLVRTATSPRRAPWKRRPAPTRSAAGS